MSESTIDLTPDELVRVIQDERAPMRRFRQRHLLGITRLAMPFPALLDFEFYSPRATLLIDAALTTEEAYRAIRHQYVHLAHQRRRYRRAAQTGLCDPLRIGGESTYFPWADVDQCLFRRDLELPAAHKELLAHASPACPGCRAPAGALTWVYFVSPDDTWLDLSGCAGWLAVCHHCREQVAFFLDRCN
jgi:hypothetical protein